VVEDLWVFGHVGFFLALGGVSRSRSKAIRGLQHRPAIVGESRPIRPISSKESHAMQDNKNRISDPRITQAVTQRLANRGIRPPSRISVTSANGQVTLSGSIQYEHQRHAVLHTTRAVEGVRRVVDMLKLITTPPRN
jgi:BON domain